MKYMMAIILLLVSGCASQWYLNGHTPNQFYQDDAQCALYSNQTMSTEGASYTGYAAGRGNPGLAAAGGGVMAMDLANAGLMYDQCMRAKGYIKGP